VIEKKIAERVQVGRVVVRVPAAEVRRADLDHGAGRAHAMQFAHEPGDVGHVLDDVLAEHLLEVVSRHGPGRRTEVVHEVGVCVGADVQAERAVVLGGAAADVEDRRFVHAHESSVCTAFLAHLIPRRYDSAS
jgi:hypothetical protein